MEIAPSLRALDRARVEMVWHAPKARHQAKNPGWSAGQPPTRHAASAKGSRKLKRPQTLMYSSRAWPRRFMAVLRRTWNSAAARARAIHMVSRVAPAAGAVAPGGSRGQISRATLIDAESRCAAKASPMAASGKRWVMSGRPRTAPWAIEPHGLAKLVPVDHRSQQGDLAADDPEERHGRRLVRQPGEDDAPAGPDQRQRVGHGVRRPRRLHHEVDSLAPGELLRHVGERTVGEGVRALRAQLAGQGEAPRAPAHHEHPRPPRAQHLQAEQSRACRRPPPPRSRPARGAAAPHRPRHHGERFRQEQVVVRDARAGWASSTARAPSPARRSRRRRRCRWPPAPGRGCGSPRGTGDSAPHE